MNPRPLFLSYPCPCCGAGRGVHCHEIDGKRGSVYPRRFMSVSHMDREPAHGETGGFGLLSELATLWVRGVL